MSPIRINRKVACSSIPTRGRKMARSRCRRFSPSDDGQLLAYARSEAGSDWQQIYVVEVATGKDNRRAAQMDAVHADRVGQGRQRFLLQPLPRAAAGRVASGVGAQPDDFVPQTWHEASRRQGGLSPARPSRLEFRCQHRPTTANIWCSISRRSTDPQNQVLVRDASAPVDAPFKELIGDFKNQFWFHRQRRHQVFLPDRSRCADEAHCHDGHRAPGPRAR